MTWGLYARVSTEEQANEGLSIESQLNALRAWAKAKGVTTREYVDAGKSAWTENLDKRPKFKAMTDDVRNGELEGVAVTHLDRFSRKLIVTLQTLGEFGRLGVGFVSLENAAFDFSRPADKLLLAVLGAFAEYYSAELSRKMQRSMTTRADKGLHVGTLPFGYCNGRCMDCKKDADKGELCERWGARSKSVVLHPDDAPGVLLAFQTYRKGNVSDNETANTMNAAGYRSRSPRGRVLWNRWSVATLLTNPTYTGMVPYKGRLIPGTHPAIISRELFDEVQAIRRKRHHRPKVYNPKYRVYLFNGLLICAGCGRKMRAQAWGFRAVPTYRCTSKESKHDDCPLKATHVKEDTLTQQFAGIVAQFKLPDDWLARVTELINANGKPRDVEGERRLLSDRLTRLKKQYEWGDVVEQEYTSKRNEIKRALAELNPPEQAVIVDAARYLQNMASVWECAMPIDRRDMVRAIFDDMVCDVDKGRLVSLRPKQAFRPLLRQVRGLKEREGIFEIAA